MKGKQGQELSQGNINMQTIDLFTYTNYKKYVVDRIRSRPRGGRGYKSVIADSCGCRLSYVSEILNNSANFSLEQAESLNQLFDHTADESDYFLLLVQLGRAGSKALENRLYLQIEKVRAGRLVLRNRLDLTDSLSLEDQAMYYSSWHYAAIHILASLKHLQSREELQTYLNLPKDRVAEVLAFLTQKQLLQLDRGRYRVGNGKIFLGNDSPHIIRHHTNWRLRAIESLDKRIKSDLHYSSVVSLKNSDISICKEILVKAIAEVRRIVRESPVDEDVQVFTVDFFKL